MVERWENIFPGRSLSSVQSVHYRAMQCTILTTAVKMQLLSSDIRIVIVKLQELDVNLEIVSHAHFRNLIYIFFLVYNCLMNVDLFYINYSSNLLFSCFQVVSWSGHRAVINFKKPFYFFPTTFTFISFCWLGSSRFNIFILSLL